MNKVLMKIFGKFDPYAITTFKKAPFDFVITVPEGKMKIIGAVADSNEPHLDTRVDEILSVSKVIQAHPMLITDGRKLTNKDISCIRSEELSKIRSPEDLISNITLA
jgi:predicted transcriptional regulator